MQRRIDLLNEQYSVTVFGRSGGQYLQVADGAPRPVALSVEGEFRRIVQLGHQRAQIQMAVKGETVYIRAFDRCFRLRIVDPVEQAAQETGGCSSSARAPMPGTVVQVQAAAGDWVIKGQPLITIESMKILTEIKAPRDGEVECVHLQPGESFQKRAVLVTLVDKKEIQSAPDQIQP